MNASVATQYYKREFSLISTNVLLVGLLSIDFAFIALHFYNSIIPDSSWNPHFSLVNDDSFAEVFQYLKWLLISVSLLIITFQKNKMAYVFWALLFAYFLLDDAMEVHEVVGAYLVKDMSYAAPFGLRLQDIGELIVSATVGLFLFSSLAWAYLREESTFRNISKDLILLVVALVFFGVGVDMLHEIIHPEKILNFIFEVVEDGGEMVIASLMLWYVVHLYLDKQQHDKTLISGLKVLFK